MAVPAQFEGGLVESVGLRSMYSKYQQRLLRLPHLLIAAYLLTSIGLFVISPMWGYAENGIWSVLYGLCAVACFSAGYFFYARRERSGAFDLRVNSRRLDVLILAICTFETLYYIPQIDAALSYYGFGFFDAFDDLGSNYLKKDALIDEIGQIAFGPFYTFVNILSFTQLAAFAIPMFRWKDISLVAKIFYSINAIVVCYFYLAIGTMNGVFYVIIMSFSGWLAGRCLGGVEDQERTARITGELKKILLYCGVGALTFFSFMIINLSSRLQGIRVDLPFLYSEDSVMYRVLGPKMGDAVGLALAYISHGWYGLSNCFKVDFYWTGGLSSSRVITSYYYRFAGIVSDPVPLSYPVRQENLTGYPAFAFWHTIFPWLASDFTFAGALVLTLLFGLALAKIWINAIREGCLVSVTLFGLLMIGALFMNANSQILDNKPLTLALFGLLLLYPFRRVVNGWFSPGRGVTAHELVF